MTQVFIEDEVTELKKSTGELKEALISVVAILNKHHKGTLYFGIKDDGTVVGQQVSGKTLRDISQAISQIEPAIYPEVNNVKIEEKDCIVVNFEGSDVPYSVDGRSYIRVSDQDRKLTTNEMRRILREKIDNDETWDSKISDKTIDDVNEDVLKDYIKRANDAKRITFEYTNKLDVLKRLNLIDKMGRLINAGKVLFCDDSGVELQMAIFATTTKTTFIDIDRVKGNVFDLIKKGQEYIRKNMIWNVKISDKREEYPEIPLEAIREAIVNSYSHRLYLDPKGTEISIFKDRIEIYNPGTFPEEYTPIDYAESNAHSIFRNPLIAELLYKSKDSESFSTGFQRIYNECQENDVKVGFQKEAYGFTIIFYRKNFIVGDSLIEETEKSDEEILAIIKSEYPELRKLYFDILRLIIENNHITQEEMAVKLNKTRIAISKNMRVLKDRKIIERIGNNKNGYWKINV